MNLFAPAEIVENYCQLGKAKAEKPLGKLAALSILAGMFIAFGAVAAATAAFGLETVSAQRLVSGLIFPIGLGMVMLLGAELFTGNCLICISVLQKRATLAGMLRNWVAVYLGNFVGAVLVAAGVALFGQLNYSGGALAVYTIKTAAAKCSLPFANGVVQGVFCNVLVCAGVLCALSAKDTAGRILGAYIPVVLFVIAGFEHCVANMYYIPAGLFAMAVPEYAALAAEAGIDTAALGWGAMLGRNLLPVTIGNILGGAGLGLALRQGLLAGGGKAKAAKS